MPSKSDSAGKLHQYYTCKYLELKSPGSKCITPLDNKTKRDVHISSFSLSEIISLKKIGDLSADEIILIIGKPIITIEDIGVSSGAVGIMNTDDLVITTAKETKKGFSLKCGKGIGQILSKNMGAKSLIKEYFNDTVQQNIFNKKMLVSHLVFLNSILGTSHTNISNVKKDINKHAIRNGLDKARFADLIYSHSTGERDKFLKTLRDNLYNILKGLDKKQIINACNLILDTGKNHIIADYKSGKEKAIFVSTPVINVSDINSINIRGNDSVAITTKDYIIGFRYKFESGITSSIKLVGDYKKK